MECPMCGLGEKHQQPDPNDVKKTQCKGCLTKFYDRSKQVSE